MLFSIPSARDDPVVQHSKNNLDRQQRNSTTSSSSKRKDENDKQNILFTAKHSTTSSPMKSKKRSMGSRHWQTNSKGKHRDEVKPEDVKGDLENIPKQDEKITESTNVFTKDGVQASFTEAEKQVLSGLFIDGYGHGHDHDHCHGKDLTDNMLFSIPSARDDPVVQHSKNNLDRQQRNSTTSSSSKRKDENDKQNILFTAKHSTTSSPMKSKKSSMRSRHWKAHHDHHINVPCAGIMPSFLRQRLSNETKSKFKAREEVKPEDVKGDLENIQKRDTTNVSTKDGIKSDTEVRASHCNSNASFASSWPDEEGGFEHFDCWQLLYDEYARDFGFGGAKVIEPNDSMSYIDEDYLDKEIECQFRILGTAADDLSAQPHCLSPPLMDSLLNFVPESQSCENYWLKYSLVRDGASLDTFRQYTRAATHTLLAIQTTNGDVFGCFTSSPWHTQNEYFGNGECFVWKMRHNRKTRCYSLYDQAHLETEIDVYPFSGFNNTVQLCRHDMIAVGGSDVANASQEGFDYRFPTYNNFPTYKNKETGFAIALQDDLCRGTSAACPTFCSPRLDGNGTNIFEVKNLEVWTFTPCCTVDEAEKLEMRKYFVSQNTNASSREITSSFDHSSTASSSNVQKRFYSRLGDRDEHEVERDCWAEASNLACEFNFTRKSPRFMSR